ncbi:hypothetical protein ACFWM5_34400 [Streptomyces bobili]|uniref:hypothetical protein n=1 Tax=Streptomyces bobili TaxID=67280 RepID=UPI003648CFB5
MSVPRTRAFAAVTPLPRTSAIRATSISLSTETETDTGTGTGTGTTLHIDAGQHLGIDTKHPLTPTSTPRTSGTS